MLILMGGGNDVDVDVHHSTTFLVIIKSTSCSVVDRHTALQSIQTEMEAELKELRHTFESGKTRSPEWRKSQLKALLNLVHANQQDMFDALNHDLGKHHVESYRDEVGLLIKSIKYILNNLDQWMKTKKVFVVYQISLPPVAFPSTAELVPEPLGLVLVISSWNLPMGLSLEPLIGAIAAGNVVVLKPSELAPASSSFLAKTLPMFLDNKAIKVVEGSQQVGRLVMAAAAKHLTPVTLELGGKCPAVLDTLTSSRDIAVNRILGSKFGSCCGQVCLAIDYLLVEEKFAPELIDLLKTGIKKMFGERPLETKTLARIVNQKHFSRLKGFLSDPMVEASVVYGGSLDEKTLYIEPTLLVNPPLDSCIMTEEIFGPVLPIITLNKIEDSVKFISSRPKPLALNVFTHNETLKRRIISETSSGSITFNDAVIQYLCDTVPFGGVGQSGFGRYHGKFSFDTFSHEKPVVRRGYLVEYWFRYPPWNNDKFELLKRALAMDYLGFLLILLGLRKN
ncbi:hypothetical protein Syun_002769 [Stephania yunnanensis]|uniref:Aldehyde dehydrogenase n=1 Tax=Stephania yunnanensis TaxID=152371 RepID=A0AAP0LM46_9MAGN